MSNITVKAYENSINAMIAKTNDLKDALASLEAGKTLKAAKEIANQHENSPALPIGIAKDLKDADKARTKALYTEAIELVIKTMFKAIKLAQDESAKLKESNTIRPEAKTEKKAKPNKDTDKKGKTAMPSKVAETKVIALDTDKLTEIAEDIRESIETAMKAHFQAGKLLSEALEMFKAAGKPAKEWISWAGLQCGIKKAQAYNLVKIYDTFGLESDFSNCSMRVLNALVHLDNKLFEKIKEEASALAKADKLTTKQVNRLINTVKPKKAEPAKPAQVDKAQDDKAQDRTSEVMKAELSGQAEESNTVRPAQEMSKADMSELEKLRAENEALKAQLAEMNETLKRMEKKADAKPAQVAPYLPQFDSDCPATVLGVKLGAGPAEVNRVFRSMAKIFNASTCPEGAKALKAARKEMLKPASK
jgi:hypothetical protein